MKYKSIAIDGPSGAGKSTMAKALAAKLGFLYVDTGAIYRTIGLYVFQNHIAPEDGEAVSAALESIYVDLRYDGEGRQQMLLNGRDVSQNIRLPEISRFASAVSALPAVRAHLLELQRALGRVHNVIMDGRDIGTVVLPDAEVKIYLTAAPQARAERRCRELEQRGTPRPFEEVLRDIEARDWRDTHRAAAPLRKAEDAVLLDTTGLDFLRARTGL